MSFLDRAKAAAEQAANKAKGGIEDVQVKRDLTQAYSDLGRTAYSLAQRNEISHAELTPLVQRVSELEAQAATGAPQPPAGGPAASPPPPPGGPEAPPPPGGPAATTPPSDPPSFS